MHPGTFDGMTRNLLHAPPVQLAGHLGEGHLMQGFDAAVANSGLPHVRRAHLPMRSLGFDEIRQACGITIEATLDSMGQRLLLGHADERELVEVVSHHGSGHVRVATDSIETADALLARVSDALREPADQVEDPRVPIWFWTISEHGPEPMRRRLHAPRWDEIAGNYVEDVSGALAQIMASPPDAARGIALWRGAPGTGKTTALRALARAWRDHVDVHVIVDPEVFLGERASYLVQVLFGHDVDEHWDEVHYAGYAPVPMHGYPGAMATFSASAGPAPRAPRAKLIVLEDAGELISADARVSSGQALSRLLNLTDGMLGQGANVSVLVTTNEPIDRLHPAVARPGRGWANVEFRELSITEANAWLDGHGCSDRVVSPTTLAELYGLVRGDQIVTLDALDS